MDRNQMQIFNWLRQVSPDLATLYKGAAKLIEEENFPGRGRFICHAMRELRNRLPEVVTGKLDIKRLDYRNEVEKLVQAWENSTLGSVYDKQIANVEGEFGQRIPKEVLIQINQLLEKHKRVVYTNREKMKRLLVELEPENKALQESLYPVVNALFVETEWFVDHAHVGKEIDDDDLVNHFIRFEQVLDSLIGYFYEGMSSIEAMTTSANKLMRPPNNDEVNRVVLRLGRARYRTYFFDNLENQYWINPLIDKGFFRGNEETETIDEYEQWPQGWYLKKIASKIPTVVLEIIKKIKSQNPFVRSDCLACLLEMPENEAVKGVDVVKNFLAERKYSGQYGWFWGGKQAAELMLKLNDKHTKKSFEIAKLLFDIWRPEEKEAGIYERIRSKFDTHEYNELVFDYYSKVWEKRPFYAVCILIEIYDNYLEECLKEKKYDISECLGVSLRDLEDDYHLDRNIEVILVKALCEAGQAVIEKDPEKVSELLDNLEKRSKGVFHRVEMYLLRFVSTGAEKDRINKIIGTQKFIESPYFKYEHRHLFNDKFEEVNKRTRDKFVEWVKQQKISQERRKEIEEWYQKNNDNQTDFERLENWRKAKELYLVRDRFKELYEHYKAHSGVKSDIDLAPHPMVGEVRAVSPMEGSPLSFEEMKKRPVEEILDYISEPKNYEGKKTEEWNEPKDALEATFKEDVRQRPLEYLKIDTSKLLQLDPGFLGSLFYGLQESVRAGSFSSDGWMTMLDLARIVITEKKTDVKYKECYDGILWGLRDGFDKEPNGIKFDEEIVKLFWSILSLLIKYKGDEVKNDDEDPIQRRCRSVVGQAVELSVSLGVVCKQNFPDLYKNYLKGEIERIYDFVLKEIKLPEIVCTFGSEFARIYWLNQEWVESNLEYIFDGDIWSAVWGTYISWGRPSPPCFKFLVEKGIYSRAVTQIEKDCKYNFHKKYNKGLVKHLMIGFFNGWINLEDEPLNEFFEKAPAELRGKAAKFLTTGFKSINEEGGAEKEKVADRMRSYWKTRLAAIEEDPEGNEKEAIELTGWIENTVLSAKETLELLNRSLVLSRGKIGERRNARGFVNGICKIAKGNELLALECLKKASVDENIHSPYLNLNEKIKPFLESLPEELYSIGREVADLYGRYNPDKYRDIWEKLSNNLGDKDLTL